MTTFERIKELARKQGKSLNKVEEELGYGKNVLYRLKNSNPSAERLQEIADYFNVSVDYLLGREDDPHSSRVTETELEEALKGAMTWNGQPLTEQDKEAVRIFLQGRKSNKWGRSVWITLRIC